MSRFIIISIIALISISLYLSVGPKQEPLEAPSTAAFEFSFVNFTWQSPDHYSFCYIMLYNHYYLHRSSYNTSKDCTNRTSNLNFTPKP